MTNKSTRETGSWGEQKAVEFLLQNNYTILKTNYRIGRIGEIDIIAREAEYTCFIEVKTRRSRSFGAPVESVTASKQKKLRQLASIYLSNTAGMDKCVRFDVVEILAAGTTGPTDGGTDEIESINLIKNAF